MDSQIIFQKTAAGQEEVAARTHKELIRYRTVLILIDGKASVEQLVTMAGKLCNVPEALEQLRAAGLIEAVKSVAVPQAAASSTASAAPNKETLQKINRALYDAIGPAADDLCMQVEKCRSYPELKQVAEKCSDLVKNIAGKRKADEFSAMTNTLLAQAG
jgi:hypothetical protein